MIRTAALALLVFCSPAAGLRAQGFNEFTAGAGSWSVAGNWSRGHVPLSGEAVRIAAGSACAIDRPLALDCRRLVVRGRLRVAAGAATIRLVVQRIDVYGAFTAGSSSAPFPGRLVITLAGGTDTGVETKRIVVHPGGVLRLFGDDARTPWLRSRDLPVRRWQGAHGTNARNVLELERPVAWRRGDRIVIASTDFDMHQAEELTLTADAPAATGPVMVQRTGAAGTGMACRHYSCREYDAQGRRHVDMRAPVGLLDRNIVIQGRTDATRRWGGDLIVLEDVSPKGTGLHLSHVELRRMGKYGHLGRYPVHFHRCGDMAGRAVVEGCSIHHSYHRAVTIHDTHGVVVRDNVVYDTYGHAFFLEDGDETGNVLAGNLGILVRTPEVVDVPANRGRDLGTPMQWVDANDPTVNFATTVPDPGPKGEYKFFRHHDRNPAVFWISNLANRITGNVAAGSDAYGFSFDLLGQDYGALGNDPRSYAGAPLLPRNLSGPEGQFLGAAAGEEETRPAFAFADNTAHSCGRVGFFSDEGAGGRAVPVLVDGEGHAVGHGSLGFRGCTAFKCRRAGVWYRQYGECIWSGARLSDNALAVYLASEGITEDGPYWELRDPQSGWFHRRTAWTGSPSPAGITRTRGRPGVPTMAHGALVDALVIGDSANTGHDPAVGAANPDWRILTLGSGRREGRSLPFARQVLDARPGRAFAVSWPRAAREQWTWVKGFDVYDGVVGVVGTRFEHFTDKAVAGGTRRGAVFGTKRIGVPGRVGAAGDTGRGNPWHVDPRNYVLDVSFHDANVLRLPAPLPALDVRRDTVAVPDSMGFMHENGLNDAVLFDIDGSITGSSSPAYVVNANNPWLREGAVSPVAVPAQQPEYHWLPADSNRIGAVQIELPWDWRRDAGGVGGLQTSRFRFLEVSRAGSGTPPLRVYDPFIGGSTLFGVQYSIVRDHPRSPWAWSKKRIFAFNALLGDAGVPAAGPRYEIGYAWPGGPVRAPNVDFPVDFLVRLRYAQDGSSVILTFPYTVGTPAVGLAVPPLKTSGSGAVWKSTATTFRPAPAGSRRAAHDARGYVVRRWLRRLPGLRDLERSPHSGWHLGSGRLHLKLVTGIRSTAVDLPFRGREVMLLVRAP